MLRCVGIIPSPMHDVWLCLNNHMHGGAWVGKIGVHVMRACWNYTAHCAQLFLRQLCISVQLCREQVCMVCTCGCDSCALMHICFSYSCALMCNCVKNRHAYVRACGGESRALEAKLRGFLKV
jgi:hypothetical protein